MTSDLNFNSAFFEQFECPICFEFFKLPIHLCNLGHSICNRCKERSRNCPQCRQPFVQNSRNISLEKMFEQVSKRCKFTECSSEVTLDQWHNHQSECQYNPNLKCLECGSSEEFLINHLVRNHEYKEISMEQNECLRSFSGPMPSWHSNTEWPKGIWKFGEEYLVVKAKTHSGVFHVYLYRISKNLTAISLEITNQDTGACIKFKGDIPHISDYIDLSTSPHFNCEIKQLMTFIKVQEDEQDTYKLSVKVKKKDIGMYTEEPTIEATPLNDIEV